MGFCLGLIPGLRSNTGSIVSDTLSLKMHSNACKLIFFHCFLLFNQFAEMASEIGNARRPKNARLPLVLATWGTNDFQAAAQRGCLSITF